MERSRNNSTYGLVQEHTKSSFFVAFSVSVCLALIAIASSVFCMAALIVPAVIGSGYLAFPALGIAFIGFTCPFFTFFGWRGADRENIKDLKVCRNSTAFYLLVCLFFAVYICIGTSYHPGSARNLYQSIVHYHDDAVTARHLDTFQSTVKCCGIKNLYDWNKNEHFSCEEDNPDTLRCSVPASCCVKPKVQPYLNTLEPNKNATKGRHGAAGQKQRRRIRIPPVITNFECGMGALNDSTFLNRRREEVLYTGGCGALMDDYIRITVLFLEVITVMFVAYFACLLRMTASVLSYLKKNIRRYNRHIRNRVYYTRRVIDHSNNVFEPPVIVED